MPMTAGTGEPADPLVGLASGLIAAPLGGDEPVAVARPVTDTAGAGRARDLLDALDETVERDVSAVDVGSTPRIAVVGRARAVVNTRAWWVTVLGAGRDVVRCAVDGAGLGSWAPQIDAYRPPGFQGGGDAFGCPST
jgi:hypothetical protein